MINGFGDKGKCVKLVIAMAKDKYTAFWVSYSSIKDFQNCPRGYFLKNVYRDPDSGRKMKIISPPLALGQIVHEVLESLSVLPVEKRFRESLIIKFEKLWEKVTGKKGGFIDDETETKYKERGKKMLTKVTCNPGPLANLAVKIKMNLPYFWLSEKDNIILCGKIDWLEYNPDTDGVHIIDFKTNKKEADSNSMQLPIYQLLVENCQKRPVEKVSYWYLERNDKPTEMKLADTKKEKEKILKIAKEIKLARQLERFVCPHKTGCYACKPYEAVLAGEAELVGEGSYSEDIYILNEPVGEKGMDSEVL